MCCFRSPSTSPIPIGCRTRLAVEPGDVVTVPLGARAATAVVWGENPAPDPRLDNRMREIEDKLDLPPLKPELRRFVDWVASYTLAPRGMVLRMALRMGEHPGRARERVGVRLAGPAPTRMTAARGRVLALLADGLARGKSEVAHAAAVSAGVIDGLIDEGTLESLVLPPEPVARAPDPAYSAPDFTPAQRAAAEALRTAVSRWRIRCNPARRCDRIGQDAGLFRGRERGHPPRAAGARPAPGNRLDEPAP